MRKFITKTKTFFVDHFHILFKSAADNHLRIQKILKNTDGSYQLTVKFGSYTELKNYQKKVRRVTVSLSSAIAMVLVAFVISPYVLHPNRSAASTFLWNQTSWSGGVNNTPITTNTTPNGGNTYAAVDASGNAIVSNGTNSTAPVGAVTLKQQTLKNTGEAGTAVNDTNNTISTFNYGTSGFYQADSTGKYSATGTVLALKKNGGASCNYSQECKSSTCSGNICLKQVGENCSSASECSSGYCYQQCLNITWSNGTSGTAYTRLKGTYSYASSLCAAIGGGVVGSRLYDYSLPDGYWLSGYSCPAGQNAYGSLFNGASWNQYCDSSSSSYYVVCLK